MSKYHHLAGMLLFALLLLSAFTCKPESLPRETSVVLQDGFENGILDSTQWVVTRESDFAEMIVDVYDIHRIAPTDYRLRLRANTIGTSDSTVKFLGVRHMQKIDFSEPKVISFDLDWNNQANGSYLTAGLFLCPIATEANPGREADWISFEYIGVPPGKNARFQIARTIKGNLRFLFTEGWPDQQRTGRKISNQHVELTMDGSTISVKENGNTLFFSGDHGLNFTQAYLYLQMSSHSNYPSREVYFNNILVKSTVPNR